MVKILSCLVLTLAVRVSAAEPAVAIQPLGKVPAAQVEKVKAGIRALYGVRVEVLPAKPLPQAAYYPPRDRYKADKLLDILAAETPADFTKVVGLTARDISTRKDEIPDWGIFGLGQLGGRACVVSTYRLHAGRASEPLFESRLSKVVVHELGHTFGLDHCPVAGCFMQDAGGKIATVDGEAGKPCPACAAKLPLKAP
ncbi:hypothetical protein [Luteolibacter sp. LG18]|uniref:hypothetical protein n=1 Tax=Luteolibacter sp. LG18 TaxID=2819286 RepID=UPI002B2D976E|nr:hypothetical protein llg_15350 [Luteolibacter sp. LG18]